MFEALFRIIAMGFICGKNTYLKDPFNVFDFILITLTSTYMLLEQKQFSHAPDLKFISSFRSLRALRPLRLIRQNV